VFIIGFAAYLLNYMGIPVHRLRDAFEPLISTDPIAVLSILKSAGVSRNHRKQK
jgi:hypothetical protein